ncbi:MAG: hypothetical protein WCD16_01365, partial [Paracoccaceae bacterium]
TLGHALMLGRLPDAVLRLLPPLADAPVMSAALGLFVTGAGALIGLVYIGAAVGVTLRRRRAA